MLSCFARKLRLDPWAISPVCLIATANVAGCSERSHFYLLADRCVSFQSLPLFSCCLLFTFASDLSVIKPISRRDGELRVATMTTPKNTNHILLYFLYSFHIWSNITMRTKNRLIFCGCLAVTCSINGTMARCGFVAAW